MSENRIDTEIPDQVRDDVYDIFRHSEKVVIVWSYQGNLIDKSDYKLHVSMYQIIHSIDLDFF
jgi:hypothetical protein